MLKKSLVETLSAILLKHPSFYEYTRQDNLIQFFISKLKNILLICLKQPSQVQVINIQLFNIICALVYQVHHCLNIV